MSLKTTQQTPQGVNAAQDSTEDRRAAVKAIRDEIKEMGDADLTAMLKGLCVKTPEDHVLSVKNMVLLVKQNPSVSIVAGFKQWQRAGRQVRKGERGSLIFIPCNGKKSKTEPSVEKDAGVFFKMVYVFDIKQTELLNADC
jgi:N-terminal domain of anti-restriction factor ArdC